MRDRIVQALAQITGNPDWEAQWLNTVSLLEFTGARKISRTVAAHHPRLEVLHHLADETRHALVFKKLACEVARGEPNGYLCPEAAKAYFADLDAGLAHWLEAHPALVQGELPYLLTTAAIERRAMQLYPILRSLTVHAAVRDELSRVIIEEQSHRRSLEERCVELLRQGGVEGLNEALALEEKLFSRFWGEVEAFLAQQNALLGSRGVGSATVEAGRL